VPCIPATVTLKGIWAALVGLAFAIVLALLAVQTARIEGFRVWPINIEGWKPLAQRMQAERDALIDAQEKAGAAQAAVNAAAQSRYQQLAERADNEHERNLEAARLGARNYITANRLRPAPDHSAPGETVAATGSDSASSSDGPGAPAIVDAIAITESDLLICTDNTARLVAVREWALGLGE